jgi:hypothetical protein
MIREWRFFVEDGDDAWAFFGIGAVEEPAVGRAAVAVGCFADADGVDGDYIGGGNIADIASSVEA